ncbi:MAG: insulinase family protein [Acidobacteriota bacterium]|nr:insulinase family protein [Acidobacteriota bacterium]
MKTLCSLLIISAGLTAQIPSYKALKYPPLRQVQIPDIATFTLPNGMKLYLLENHELPLVRGVALVRTGNLFDPPDKVGLATMTGDVMRSGGTRDKTGDQLDEQLENIAASVESDIGERSGRVSFSTLKERTDEVLGVFKDVLTGPEFREDKIELIKNQLRSSISRRNDDPHGIAQREFADLLYGRDTPYGWQMQYATVDAIQRADLIAFYKRYFFPSNIMLAVQGDFSAPEMRAKLEKLFASWTYQQPPVPAFPAVREKPNPGVFLATKTDVTQTYFVFGQFGGLLKEKDYPALEVMADILGGGFRSRLFQRVRTQLGYAYNISSNWGAGYDHPGLFQVSGSTKSLSTTEAIKVAREEMNRMRTAEVTSEELDTAKQSVINSFVFNFDTRSKTLNRVLAYEYYGYPKDFIFQYQKAVTAVTKADILRVAKDRLHPNELTVVAVGNPKAFGEPLSALGSPVTPLDISIPEPKAAAATADAASLEKGKQLLRKIQDSVGGADKLAAVRDFQQKVDVTVNQGAGGMKVVQVNQWLSPSYFRQESLLPFGKMTAFSDGSSGWMVTPQGSGPLPEQQLKQTREELFRNYFPFLLSDRAADRTVNFVSDNELEISEKGGTAVRLFFDPKTGLPSKQTYRSVQPQGAPVSIEETFRDFRDVQGIKVPYRITIVQNGAQFADLTVQDFKINTGLTPETIGKKP